MSLLTLYNLCIKIYFFLCKNIYTFTAHKILNYSLWLVLDYQHRIQKCTLVLEILSKYCLKKKKKKCSINFSNYVLYSL